VSVAKKQRRQNFLVAVQCRARICKCLRRSGIASEDSIPPACVAWRTGTTNMVVETARKAGNRFLGSLKGLQIRALVKRFTRRTALYGQQTCEAFFDVLTGPQLSTSTATECFTHLPKYKGKNLTAFLSGPSQTLCIVYVSKSHDALLGTVLVTSKVKHRVKVIVSLKVKT